MKCNRPMMLWITAMVLELSGAIALAGPPPQDYEIPESPKNICPCPDPQRTESEQAKLSVGKVISELASQGEISLEKEVRRCLDVLESAKRVLDGSSDYDHSGSTPMEKQKQQSKSDLGQ